MKNEMIVQQENINELVKLQTENPDAKVICFVDNNLFNDDFSYTAGNFTKPYVDLLTAYDETYRDEEESKDYLYDTLYTNGILTDEMTDEEAEEVVNQEYEKLGCDKFIIIYINS